VSALHGRASGDLLDAILQAPPETPSENLSSSSGRGDCASEQERGTLAKWFGECKVVALSCGVEEFADDGEFGESAGVVVE
jgi:hypothetical protein